MEIVTRNSLPETSKMKLFCKYNSEYVFSSLPSTEKHFESVSKIIKVSVSFHSVSFLHCLNIVTMFPPFLTVSNNQLKILNYMTILCQTTNFASSWKDS